MDALADLLSVANHSNPPLHYIVLRPLNVAIRRSENERLNLNHPEPIASLNRQFSSLESLNGTLFKRWTISRKETLGWW
jgi:hypothetical protein